MECRSRATAVAVACSVLFAAATPARAAEACTGADTPPAAEDPTMAIAATVCVLNAERAGHGRAPLRWSASLGASAGDMAGELARGRFFAHTTPAGRNLLDRVRPTGYLGAADDWILGENIAWGSGALETPAATVRGWMRSPGHRRNLLDPAFHEIGVAFAAAVPATPRSGTFYVANFGWVGAPREPRKRTARRCATASRAESPRCRRRARASRVPGP